MLLVRAILNRWKSHRGRGFRWEARYLLIQVRSSERNDKLDSRASIRARDTCVPRAGETENLGTTRSANPIVESVDRLCGKVWSVGGQGAERRGPRVLRDRPTETQKAQRERKGAELARNAEEVNIPKIAAAFAWLQATRQSARNAGRTFCQDT
ncbi:hypothetical protein AAFF_G00394540 [Aldrovandia affinis]|uniref:Uncharacterized protein n=1 Tax=Aldrovandia affinis TaxID=143900 RepID=A0AAD7SDP6_9TELE|nr:hypothetical protein AAFF_G00394540 [Aldrovandia affinis]